jgi:hypothetical protein
LTEFALPVWIYLHTGLLQQFGLLAAVGVLPGLVVGPLAGAIVAEAVMLGLTWTGKLQL